MSPSPDNSANDTVDLQIAKRGDRHADWLHALPPSDADEKDTNALMVQPHFLKQSDVSSNFLGHRLSFLIVTGN